MEVINQNLFKELKATGRLPSPKGVALALLNVMQQDDVTIQDIARIVQADPALSGRLIKFSNSPSFSSRRLVASVSEAIMVIGLPMLRHLVLGFSVLSSSREGQCLAFNYQEFWSRSLAMGIANQALSARLKGQGDESFTCGLLSGVGRLALATLFPEKYSEVLGAAVNLSLEELVRLEYEQFDTDHNELTAALLNEWGFPAVFIEAVYHQEHPEKADFEPGSRAYALVHSLHFSSSLADLCIADENLRHSLLPGLYVLAARLGIDAETLMALSDGVISEWQQWGQVLEVHTQTLPSFAVMAAALPSTAESAGSEAPESLKSTDFPLSILVVDDDKSISTYLQKILIDCGHTVITVPDGRMGLECVLECNPQLIISDWVMPNMDGIAFCKSLRSMSEGRGVYFIILTSLADEDRLVEAFEAGVDDYLIKPFSEKVLMARLRAGQRVIQLKEEIAREREELRRVASELSVVNLRLQRLAMTDPLTLLPNRRYGMDCLEKEWETARNAKQRLSCMLIDLDHFKKINDTYGHDVGDAVLKESARLLIKTIRTQDTIARIGGEEFMLICPDTGRNEAVQYADRIRRAFEDGLIRVGMDNINIKVSIGVAEYVPLMTHFNDLIKAADEGLYRAKVEGRNRVVACNPGIMA